MKEGMTLHQFSLRSTCNLLRHQPERSNAEAPLLADGRNVYLPITRTNNRGSFGDLPAHRTWIGLADRSPLTLCRSTLVWHKPASRSQLVVK
jgi:hypothetical protein